MTQDRPTPGAASRIAPTAAADPFELKRFLEAQDAGGTYQRALAELRAGRKTSHWMWFVFPQLVGLGRSEMARRFAIGGEQEARAYLAHPILGTRLSECAQTLCQLETCDPVHVLGSLDALKLHSSMNPDFFKGTAIEAEAGKVVGRARVSGA